MLLVISPVAPKAVFLSIYGAQPLDERSFPEGVALVHQLARRAALPRSSAPLLHPSVVPNAFAVGDHDDSAIALTDGMLRLLNLREMARGPGA